MGEASRLSSAFEDVQKTLTAYADELEEMKVYIHSDLTTLPKVYVDTVNDYLTAVAKNIKHRNLVEEFELKYEKARGAQFDCVHERDKIKAELDQFTLDVDKELEKLEAVKSWVEYELIEYDKRRLHFAAYKLERDRHDRLIQLDKILKAS